MATAEGEHGSEFEETMFCEPCNKEGNTVEVDGFCSDCFDYLCSTCLKYHKRLAKNHTLLDKSNMPQDFCLEQCLVHPNDLVKFYCTKCDDTACSECIPIKHQTECSEFKHIPSYMQSQDVYKELKEVKKSLKAVEGEASHTENESGQKLKKATRNSSDISKSISLQKKYIKDKIEEQRVEIFKILDDERVEFIRKLDERQGRRKEQLFEQQKLINSKIDDEANHLDEQLMLYPRKIQNIAQNSANIRSKLESLTTELVNKERQGRKAELFVATKRIKHNMKTLQRDIDDVREENTARCFTFRRNTENINIDAAETATLGSLIEESEQRDIDLESVSSYSDDDDDDSILSDNDYIIVPLPNCFDLTKPLKESTISSYSNSVDRLEDADRDFSLDDNHYIPFDSQNRDTTNGQQGAFNSPSSTDTRVSSVTDSGENNEPVEKAQRELTSEEIITKEPVSASVQMPENERFVKASDKKGGRDSQGKTVDFAPEFANQLVATAVKDAGQAYITVKAVFKTWQDKQNEAKPQARVSNWSKKYFELPRSQSLDTNSSQSDYKLSQLVRSPHKKEMAMANVTTLNKQIHRNQKSNLKSNRMPRPKYEPESFVDEWKSPAENYKPLQSECTPTKSYCKFPEDKLKSQADYYKPPQSKRKSPAQPESPKDQWKPLAEGPMAKLLQMGFFNTDLNKKLLIKHSDNLDKIVQELLSMKNKNW